MNGKKTLIFAVVALLCVGTGAFAFTVGYAELGQVGGVTLEDLTTGLAQGNLVALGNFGTMNDTQIAALGADSTAVWAAFEAWDTGAINSDLYYDEGGTALGTGWFSEQAYLVAFNASTALGADQVGVFKGPSAPSTIAGHATGKWIFPADDLGTGAMDIAGVGASGVIIGSFGLLTFNSAWNGDYVDAYALASEVIPEPSTYMLVGTGLLGLLALRRRRS